MALDPNDSERDEKTRTRRVPDGTRVVAVVSSYHGELTGAMQASAEKVLIDAGMEPGAFEVVEVPGAFELPLAAQWSALRREVDAVLCFGLVLKGETTHDQTIAFAAAQGITQVGLDTNKPVLFGLLTCQTIEQARARALPASAGGQDKGAEVARAAVDMLMMREVMGATTR